MWFLNNPSFHITTVSLLVSTRQHYVDQRCHDHSVMEFIYSLYIVCRRRRKARQKKLNYSKASKCNSLLSTSDSGPDYSRKPTICRWADRLFREKQKRELPLRPRASISTRPLSGASGLDVEETSFISKMFTPRASLRPFTHFTSSGERWFDPRPYHSPLS